VLNFFLVYSTEEDLMGCGGKNGKGGKGKDKGKDKSKGK
jgi:hypothetical protein